MFDITSSKLLILGVVALLVIGPKDLPALLRTLGRYMGIIKRHAAEFRAQFDEAMREAELDQLKKEVETVGSTAEAHMRAAEQSLETELASASGSVAPAPSGNDGAAVAAAPDAAAARLDATPDPPAPAAAAVATGESEDRSLGQSLGQSSDQSLGQSSDRSLGQSSDRSLGQSLDRGLNPGREGDAHQHVPEKSGA